MKTEIFIIDDDPDFIEDISLLLESEYRCNSSTDPSAGLTYIRQNNPDVILLDLMLGDGISGLDILEDIQQIDPELPVIMITDYSSVQTAVEAMRKGAFDYISKTPDLDELRLLISKSIRQRRLKEQTQTLQEEIQSQYHTMIGSTPAMDMVRKKIRLYADSLNTVLITGESGVGKELVARQIHLHSTHRNQPFVAINCAALPRALIESELFGYEKGAFTGATARKAGKFEIATDGIIFFDEVSELDPEAQAKLLRVIQEKEFEHLGGTTTIETGAVILCATNRDLRELVHAGKFREDLFYRLDVLRLPVPPLRERREDIPLLVDHFLKKSCAEMKKPLRQFSERALNQLVEYNWPGNVRELRNYITRSVILSQDEVITTVDLPNQNDTSYAPGKNEAVVPKTWDEMDALRKTASEEASRQVEKRYITYLLEKFDGNVTRAAEYAGIHRTNFHKIMKRCGK